MKTNVFLSTVLMFLFMSYPILHSQPQTISCFREHVRAVPFSELPGLTEEQKAEIESLQQKFRDDMKTIRESGELTKDENREIFLVKRKELHKQIEGILTPEQIGALERGIGQQPVPKKFYQKRTSPGRLSIEENHFLLKEKRMEFENLLTSEEKQVITVMREKMDAHWELMRSLMQGAITLEERREIREKHIEGLQPLREIAQKYRSEISRLTRDIGFGNRPNCPYPDFRPGSGRFHQKKTGLKDDFIPGIRFLLLEPSEKSSLLEGPVNEEIKVYPNPSAKGFTVEFDLEKQGDVTIELLNKAGELLGVLDNTNRNIGNNAFSYGGELINSPGVYFIRVKTPEKMMTAKLVRN
jgi:hypothetical protein